MRPRQILVVEDHLPDAKMLERLLSAMKTPHTLHIVSDGAEALRFLRREDPYTDAPRPDLVLLDLNLPKITGYEVLAQVRLDPDMPSTAVIIFTGSELPQDVERCYRLGANAYVIKPGSPELAQAFVGALETFWFVLGRTSRNE